MTHSLAQDLDHVLQHTQDCWEALRGGRLFITGGTGFFGTWLLESLAWANQALHLNIHAVILARNPVRFLQQAPHLALPFLEYHAGDVRSFSYPAGPFTHVVHAATPARALAIRLIPKRCSTSSSGAHAGLWPSPGTPAPVGCSSPPRALFTANSPLT